VRLDDAGEEAIPLRTLCARLMPSVNDGYAARGSGLQELNAYPLSSSCIIASPAVQAGILPAVGLQGHGLLPTSRFSGLAYLSDERVHLAWVSNCRGVHPRA